MTPTEISLVQTSFAKVVPISAKAAELFYGRLFETAPESRALFKGDMREQGRKLMAMLATVVNGLDKLETLLPAIQAMSARHVGYGVTPAQYRPVGEALFWTLGQGLGPEFTPETEAAWRKAYSTLAGVMIRHAYGEAA